MPVSKGRGGKHRRRGKTGDPIKRELLVKEPGQEYAQVLKLLGNSRVEALCVDNKRRLCHIRGKLPTPSSTTDDMVQFAHEDANDDEEELVQDFRGELPPSDDDMYPSEEDIDDLDGAIDDL
ncbi:hypothetical protein GEMRC1_011819 [Eukaryota sp. GEM-RC1]